jgi:hypothetical protein
VSDRGIAEGYLVISDISGYTAFLSGTELEHAQGIIEDLTETILGSLTPVLTFVKLEGDAAFCYAPTERFSSPEYLLGLLETCYCAFEDRISDMRRNTTCTCTACASIGTLDLKFVAHRGSYVVRRVAGTTDLAGPDVIAVHRLLKNSVRESTGLSAYAFVSNACLDALPPATGSWSHAESYESLGTIDGRVYDMKRAAERLRDDRSTFIEADQADGELVYDLDVPAAVAWALFSDAAMAPKWSSGSKDQYDVPNEEGRVGIDSERHCDHGNWASRSRVLDWKPPHYYTLHRVTTKTSWNSPPPSRETLLVEPRQGGGSRVTFRIRLDDRGIVNRLKMKTVWPLVRRSMLKDTERLNAFAHEQYLSQAEAEEAAAEVASR